MMCYMGVNIYKKNELSIWSTWRWHSAEAIFSRSDKLEKYCLNWQARNFLFTTNNSDYGTFCNSFGVHCNCGTMTRVKSSWTIQLIAFLHQVFKMNGNHFDVRRDAPSLRVAAFCPPVFTLSRVNLSVCPLDNSSACIGKPCRSQLGQINAEAQPY